MLRFLLVMAMVLGFTTKTDALEARWTSGGRDLRLTGAGRCTLLVSEARPGVDLPQELRLIWVAAPKALQLRSVLEQGVSLDHSRKRGNTKTSGW
jgi:hypothetical protein